jgi:hypothetical protein
MTNGQQAPVAAMAVSNALRRAVANDRARIATAQARLHAERAGVHARLAELDAEIRALAERAELLDRLTGPAEHSTVDAPARRDLGEVLRGAAIRRVATQLLYEQHGAGYAIHYRDWLAALQARGYVVLAKNPAATFLSNIVRSPIVAHGPQPGTYYVDDTIVARLRRELAEQHAELRDLANVIAAHDGVSPIALREHRTLLSATVRRLERDVAESDATLKHDTRGAR